MGDQPDASRARFEALYHAHLVEVIAYAARRVRPDIVADVVSETFAVAWRRLDQVPEQALPWLLGVARRVSANQRRGERRRQALGERIAEQPLIPAVMAGERETAVLVVFSELHQRDREVLRLAAWEGLSAKEAAVVLGCSVTAYRLRLHRARRKLAERLKESEPASRPAQQPLTGGVSSDE